MEIISLITLLSNTLLPPVYNLVKGWLSKGKIDSPEQVISNLATTKPDVLAAYIDANSKLKDAETRYFNRDVSGTPSQWIIDTRASIRPLAVVIAFILLAAGLCVPEIKENIPVLITCNGVIGNWIGTKIEYHK